MAHNCIYHSFPKRQRQHKALLYLVWRRKLKCKLGQPRERTRGKNAERHLIRRILSEMLIVSGLTVMTSTAVQPAILQPFFDAHAPAWARRLKPKVRAALKRVNFTSSSSVVRTLSSPVYRSGTPRRMCLGSGMRHATFYRLRLRTDEEKRQLHPDNGECGFKGGITVVEKCVNSKIID